MKIKIIALIIVVVICVSGVFAQPKTLKFDLKYQIKEYYTVVVNDTLNHNMGLATGTGNAIMPSGTNATVNVFFTFDYTGGNGYFNEYAVLTFPDSSTVTIQAIGQSKGSVHGKNPLFTADVSILRGTGKYKDISGSGTMTGNRQEEVKTGSIVKLSYTINIKQ
jgi:hypothetical protein